MNQIFVGDVHGVLPALPTNTANCCVTSPPYYGLRDYGVPGQLGMETTPEEYVEKLVWVFREVRRVLKDDGTLWLNLGDSYNSSTQMNGLKNKDLIGIPWRVAFALQADGWYLRQDIIWHKPNPMPESVRDRCTKAHEYIFLFSKSKKYYFDSEAILEPFVGTHQGKLKGQRGSQPYASERGNDRANSGGYPRSREGRNKRSVWTITTKSFKGAHFATFPPDLIEPCILAGCPQGGVILDPFFGAGTTGLVAKKHGRFYTGIELNKDYAEMARTRINDYPAAGI